MKGSDKPTCGDHGGTNRKGEPCERIAGWGTDFSEGKCRQHRGTSPDGSSHAGNDHAVTHGAFREHFSQDLTPGEREAIDNLVAHLTGIDDERAIPAQVAAEALMKYKRSTDPRFLREARQWFSEFNLVPNEDVFEHTGDGGRPLEVVINRERYTSEDDEHP